MRFNMFRLPSRGSLVVHGVHVGATLHELTDQFQRVEASGLNGSWQIEARVVTARPCDLMQCRPALRVGVGIRAACQELPGHLVMRIHDRQDQRARAVREPLIDVGSGVEQRA